MTSRGLSWKRSRLGVRGHLALLVVLALLPAWGLAAAVAWRMADAERAGIARDAQEAARSLAATLEREVAVLRSGLQTLATSPSLANGDLHAFHHQANRFHGAEGVQVSLVDAEGHLLLDTAQPYPPEAEPSLGPGAPTAGLSGLLVGTHGRPVVRLSEPVVVAGQTAPAMLSIVTDAIWFWSNDLRRVVLPVGWEVSVLDQDNRILARFPSPEQFVGRPAHPSLLEAIPPRDGTPGQPRQGWAAAQTRDGNPVRVAWQRVQGLPWTVLVGVPQTAIDDALKHSMLPVLSGGLALLLALTVALLTWGRRYLVRPLRVLERAALSMGRGDMPTMVPHSGVRELDAVGQALVTAVAEREEREAETALLAARLRAVLDHVPVGVALAEPDRGGGARIVLANRRMGDLLAPR